jgi:rubrerythrin
MDWDKDILKRSFVVDVNEIEEKTIDEILRLSISAEFEAINLYSKLKTMIDDKNTVKIFDEIIGDEKKHVGQFNELLLNADKEQNEDMEKGKEENKEIIGK